MRLFPAICHDPVVPAAIVHVLEVAGRVSVKETPVAVPPPVLEMVTTKPAVSPAEIGEASAVLVTETSGQLTLMVAVAELLALLPEGSLVAEIVAVFERTLQSVAFVALVTWTWKLAAAAKVEPPS
jgi:hypothetical protein